VELKLWHTIVSSCGQVRVLLDRALPDAAEAQARSNDATIVVSQPVAVLKTLRDDIRTRLDELRAELAKVLSEREVYQVLFPLTIHYDELVLRRLSPTEQTAWPLLQSERYGINDGGDVFYSFADDRFANAETPPLVFEVLYFCLSDGFIGRYANDAAKIAGYKSKLAARIPMPRTPAQVAQNTVGGTGAKSRRGKGEAGAGAGAAGDAGKKVQRTARSSQALSVALFYLAAAAVVVLMPLVLVWLSNL
jgi:type VI protein secretion system component VasF